MQNNIVKRYELRIFSYKTGAQFLCYEMRNLSELANMMRALYRCHDIAATLVEIIATEDLKNIKVFEVFHEEINITPEEAK